MVYILLRPKISSSQMVDLVFALFYFSFLFSFCFIFIFSIFRTTRVRVDWSCYHTSHKPDGIVPRQIIRLRRI